MNIHPEYVSFDRDSDYWKLKCGDRTDSLFIQEDDKLIAFKIAITTRPKRIELMLRDSDLTLKTFLRMFDFLSEEDILELLLLKL